MIKVNEIFSMLRCYDACNNWLCFFLFYINDLSKVINIDAIMIFFADDTSILVKSSSTKGQGGPRVSG
jgi:hypothetical protein